jgi:hypothetical protein
MLVTEWVELEVADEAPATPTTVKVVARITPKTTTAERGIRTRSGYRSGAIRACVPARWF